MFERCSTVTSQVAASMQAADPSTHPALVAVIALIVFVILAGGIMRLVKVIGAALLLMMIALVLVGLIYLVIDVNELLNAVSAGSS